MEIASKQKPYPDKPSSSKIDSRKSMLTICIAVFVVSAVLGVLFKGDDWDMNPFFSFLSAASFYGSIGFFFALHSAKKKYCAEITAYNEQYRIIERTNRDIAETVLNENQKRCREKIAGLQNELEQRKKAYKDAEQIEEVLKAMGSSKSDEIAKSLHSEIANLEFELEGYLKEEKELHSELDKLSKV